MLMSHPVLGHGVDEHLGFEAGQQRGGGAGQQRLEHVQEHTERVEGRQHAEEPLIAWGTDETDGSTRPPCPSIAALDLQIKTA